MSRPGREPTLRDVSLRAGVSRMTVTRVFIRPDQVLPETRARVQQAVAELGYVPDRAAGSLATRRSGFVGLVLPTLVNGNFAALAEGLTESLRPSGYDLLIGYTGYSMQEEERQVRTLLSRRPEAVVLAASAHRESVGRQLARSGIPVVEVADLPEQPLGHMIGFSNHAVGVRAAEFLIGLGHTRIAALGPARCADRRDLRGEARLAGFSHALVRAGLPTGLVRGDGAIPLSFGEGARLMGRLLDEAPDLQAVFAVSDLAAVGALMECRRRGIDLPGQLSLLGFGNFEIGQQTVPSLSTIAVDFDALGRRAGRLIAALLRPRDAGPPSPSPSPSMAVDVGFTVIARQSTAGVAS